MTTHHLTEERQGEYHYTVGPYPDPVLEIEPGDTVEVETHDAFEGAIETEDDVPSEVLGDFLDPQNGSIHVDSADRGFHRVTLIRESFDSRLRPLKTTLERNSQENSPRSVLSSCSALTRVRA